LDIDARIARNVTIFYLTGTIVDIAKRRGYAIYLAANEEYNAHRYVDKAPISAEIHSTVC
jgi:hypothetical protein